MFGSLRARLIASYALIIVLTLVLAGSGFTYVIRAYQTQLRLNQLADLALPLSFQVRSLQRSGAQPGDVSQYLKDQAAALNVRIFLLGPDRRVTLDTDGGLVGQPFPLPTEERNRPSGAMQWGTGTIELSNQPRLTFVAMITRFERPAGRDVDPPLTLVVAVPEDRVTAAWLQLAPSLIAGALVAFVVASAVGLLLARSISRPLAQVTAASERMAKGDFDQFIDVTGRDEVGQLAASFNTMAREVGRMNRTMRDLLANVSHELRTPLTSIEGFSAAIVDGTLSTPDQFREAGRIIGEEAERMQRLVEDLLYLSKIESGQVSIDRTRLDLPEVLRSCVRQVQPQSESAGVAIEVDTRPVPKVLADEHRIQQVFVNLLDNAVKHTPRNGRIQVRAYPARARPGGETDEGTSSRSPSGWVAVDVFNPGSYIPPDHADRIFERFYQVDRARARRGDGSGLGLAIVHEIVQAHHGRIEVASDPSEGTTFTVYLPVAA